MEKPRPRHEVAHRALNFPPLALGLSDEWPRCFPRESPHAAFDLEITQSDAANSYGIP